MKISNLIDALEMPLEVNSWNANCNPSHLFVPLIPMDVEISIECGLVDGMQRKTNCS